jgi:CheY-like chemotaxis protein/anti-sigma regulatory factor (Ser/Thr protein kinase)
VPQRRAFSAKVQIHKLQHEERWWHWFFFSFSDVTPWLDLQEEVMNARKLESVGALASGVAHDFNNLIMAIQGHAEYLLMTRANDSELRDAMERVVKVCSSGASLTKSLLGYARKQSLEMDIIDVVHMVREVVNLARRSYGPRYQLELLEPFDRDANDENRQELPISGCYSALSNCILNVLNNSRDAMPNGGRIRVSGRVRDGLVSLSVLDEGGGIDLRHIDTVFEPFYTTKEVGAGTGLGLAMVQGIMKQHGGNVEIKSKKNVGTEFSFYWPLYAPEKGGAIKQSAENGEKIPLPVVADVPKLVYLIEDDEHVMSSIQSLVQLNGYECRSFTNPEGVLQLLERDVLPAVIIVDYAMPAMDGATFVREAYAIMRRKPKQPFMKIVLTSGYPASYFDDFLKEFDGVPINLLQKPFNHESLMKIIKGSSRRFLRKITSRVSPV